MNSSSSLDLRALRQRTRALRHAIDQMDLVCSGTLLSRTKVCGKPACACAEDQKARHGPYYEWSHRLRGRYVHHVVTREQADQLERAIANLREIQRLLAQWERESVAAILPQGRRKG